MIMIYYSICCWKLRKKTIWKKNYYFVVCWIEGVKPSAVDRYFSSRMRWAQYWSESSNEAPPPNTFYSVCLFTEYSILLVWTFVFFHRQRVRTNNDSNKIRKSNSFVVVISIEIILHCCLRWLAGDSYQRCAEWVFELPTTSNYYGFYFEGITKFKLLFTAFWRHKPIFIKLFLGQSWIMNQFLHQIFTIFFDEVFHLIDIFLHVIKVALEDVIHFVYDFFDLSPLILCMKTRIARFSTV